MKTIYKLKGKKVIVPDSEMRSQMNIDEREWRTPAPTAWQPFSWWEHGSLVRGTLWTSSDWLLSLSNGWMGKSKPDFVNNFLAGAQVKK